MSRTMEPAIILSDGIGSISQITPEETPVILVTILSFVASLLILVLIIALVLAVFRIRNAAEKSAMEAKKHTAQLETLNTQIAWLNRYFSERG